SIGSAGSGSPNCAITSPPRDSASSRGGYPRAPASPRLTQPPRGLAEAPQTTPNPRAGTPRHAPNSPPASSGESQVDRDRALGGFSMQVRMRMQIVSRPYR